VSVRILQGDCRVRMAELPAASVHCIVTSPPYWGLRDYGTAPLQWPAIAYSPMPGVPACIEIPAMECSLGLEPTLEAFIGHMLLVFREAHRVLRDDGTCWVNMGDSYAGSRCGGNSEAITGDGRDESVKAKLIQRASRNIGGGPQAENLLVPRSDVRISGLKPKDMAGQPWRLAFALQADGWWLRQDNIWHKPNPMPESAKDRCTKAHEYVFLLAKSERYYFDQDAIKEPASPDTHARYARGRSSDHKHADTAAVPGQQPQTIAQSFEHMRKPVAGWAPTGTEKTAIAHAQQADDREGKLLTRGVGWGHGTDAAERGRGRVRKVAADDSRTKNNGSFDEAMAVMPATRNKRSVWTVTTEGFPEAHFATFPTALIEPCILAGCPEGGTVLDMFGGSGTTAVVADRHHRDAILCELNPEYVAIARRRITKDAPLLTELEAA
jgi:DNA modification methylase